MTEYRPSRQDVSYLDEFFEDEALDAQQFLEQEEEFYSRLTLAFESLIKRKKKEASYLPELYSLLDDFNKEELFDEIEGLRNPSEMLRIILEKTEPIRSIYKKAGRQIKHKNWDIEFFEDTIEEWIKTPPKRGEIIDCWYFND